MNIMNIIKSKIIGSKYYIDRHYWDAESICDLPLIDKDVVIHEWENILNNSSKNLLFTHTSGSSGVPLKIAWDHGEYLQSLSTIWRKRKKHGIVPSDFYLTCHAEFDIHNKKIDSPVVVMPNYLSLSKLCMSDILMAEYIRQIQLFKPKWIYAQPSFVYYMGQYMQKYSPELTKIFSYIELVGEMLSPNVRLEIEDIFTNAKIVNMYGMQEFNSIMYEESIIMIPIEDNVYVEVLDDFGNICDINEEGNIVVTGLKNSVFPLIRYKTGDRAIRVLHNETEGYIITSGRSNDELIYNGNRYDGSLFFIVINQYNQSHSSKISRFQVILRNGVLMFFISSFDKLQDTVIIERDLANILQISFGIRLPISVTLSKDNAFVHSKNKIKYFINQQY